MSLTIPKTVDEAIKKSKEDKNKVDAALEEARKGRLKVEPNMDQGTQTQTQWFELVNGYNKKRTVVENLEESSEELQKELADLVKICNEADKLDHIDNDLQRFQHWPSNPEMHQLLDHIVTIVHEVPGLAAKLRKAGMWTKKSDQTYEMGWRMVEAAQQDLHAIRRSVRKDLTAAQLASFSQRNQLRELNRKVHAQEQIIKDLRRFRDDVERNPTKYLAVERNQNIEKINDLQQQLDAVTNDQDTAMSARREDLRAWKKVAVRCALDNMSGCEGWSRNALLGRIPDNALTVSSGMVYLNAKQYERWCERVQQLRFGRRSTPPFAPLVLVLRKVIRIAALQGLDLEATKELYMCASEFAPADLAFLVKVTETSIVERLAPKRSEELEEFETLSILLVLDLLSIYCCEIDGPRDNLLHLLKDLKVTTTLELCLKEVITKRLADDVWYSIKSELFSSAYKDRDLSTDGQEIVIGGKHNQLCYSRVGTESVHVLEREQYSMWWTTTLTAGFSSLIWTQHR